MMMVAMKIFLFRRGQNFKNDKYKDAHADIV